MKRLFALLFIFSILLSACVKSSDTPPETTAATEAPTVPTEPSTTPEPEPEPEPVVIRHPMNGSVLETPYTGRPTAVVLSNDTDALPQHSLSQADFIVEAEVEAGITRLLAIYSDISAVEGKIGPIRSARSFFNNVSLSFNAPIIHCGGSHWGINGYMDDTNKIENWAHINEQYNGSYFYRDPERSNYLSWLNLFTNADKLTAGLTALNYLPDGQTAADYGLQFTENVTLGGETAGKITVNFKGGKTTTLTYQESTGVYTAYQYGRDHIDGNTGKSLAYNNVICIYTDHTGVYDGTYTRSFYKLVGEGTGHFACNGQIVPIKWSRTEATQPFSFTLEDGTPITLNVGKTYLGIAANTVSVDYE